MAYLDKEIECESCSCFSSRSNVFVLEGSKDDL